MRKPKLFFLFLVLLTVVAAFIVVPAFSLKLPGNKTFRYPGPVINISLGSLHVQKSFPFVEGLDLQGGTSITLRADMKGVAKDQQLNALQSAKSVIERRVNLTGVKEPVVQTQQVNGDYRILVELPGVNVSEATQLVGTTAQLTFWELATSSALVLQNNVPIRAYDKLVKQTSLTGQDLKSANATFNTSSGAPEVQLLFTSTGAKKFADITSRNVNRPIAMVLDGVILEAPNVNTPILTGDAVITGNFTTDTANQLAVELRAGALPIPLHALSEQSIGATLGTGSLEKSLFAGILGFLVIVVFMVSLYGKRGVIASMALVLYTLFTLAIFKLIPVTLTLAGIAGFILSIGMAVDANILIFERMKEELRERKPMHVAMELGFNRAWSSIRDSNVSTLITSAILFYFGTGIVRGFAFTLAIGVSVSMFSAISITRTFLRMFLKDK